MSASLENSAVATELEKVSFLSNSKEVKRVKLIQSCLTLCDPTDGLWNYLGQNTGLCSRSLLQGSSQPRDRTQVSHIAGGFFTAEPQGTPSSKEGQCQRVFKLVVEKAEEPEIKLPTSTGSLKKQESS